MYSISFAISFILLIDSAMPDAASGPLQHSALTGWTGRQNPTLSKTGYLFYTSSQPFLLWMHQLEKGSSPPLGTAQPLNYNHSRKFLPQSTHYIQRLSQIYLVASRLYFLLILIVRAKKCKVRAGEHKCKARSQLETQLLDGSHHHLEFLQETNNCPQLSFVQSLGFRLGR